MNMKTKIKNMKLTFTLLSPQKSESGWMNTTSSSPKTLLSHSHPRFPPLPFFFSLHSSYSLFLFYLPLLLYFYYLSSISFTLPSPHSLFLPSSSTLESITSSFLFHVTSRSGEEPTGYLTHCWRWGSQQKTGIGYATGKKKVSTTDDGALAVYRKLGGA